MRLHNTLKWIKYMIKHQEVNLIMYSKCWKVSSRLKNNKRALNNSLRNFIPLEMT
jgi:hypothetical protein